MNLPEGLIKAEAVLESISKEFTFDPNLQTPILGRKLGEILESKRFPIRDRCLEESLVIAHKLKEAGYPTDLVLLIKRRGIMTKLHFVVEFGAAGHMYKIDVDKRLQILPAHKGHQKHSFEQRRARFNLTLNDSLAKFVSEHRGLLMMKRITTPLIPRNWPLPVNRRKDVQKAAKLNEALKKRVSLK
jgi:hypothetical protein